MMGFELPLINYNRFDLLLFMEYYRKIMEGMLHAPANVRNGMGEMRIVCYEFIIAYNEPHHSARSGM